MKTKYSSAFSMIAAGILMCAGSACAAVGQQDKIQFKTAVNKETSSQFQMKLLNVNVAGLPTSGQKNTPTLADETVTLTVGSASFQGIANSKGKVTTPFNASLKGTTFSIKYKGLALIALFGLAATPDGKDKTVPVHITITASKAGQPTVVLKDEMVLLTYTAKNGHISGKGTALGGTLLPVQLGLAGDYVILSKTGIDTIPTSVVTGNLGISPAAATFITGFDLVADATNVFSTSTQVTGKVYAADYAVPTPGNLTTAVSDMETAYTDAAGRTTPDFIDLGAGDISGRTLSPGLYKWGTSLSLNTDVTLNGGPNDVWIFQIAGDLTQANGTRVTLTGGALAKNVFWQAFGVVAIGTTAHMEGVILSKTAITLNTGASIKGRLLAQTAVTLKASTVTAP